MNVREKVETRENVWEPRERVDLGKLVGERREASKNKGTGVLRRAGAPRNRRKRRGTWGTRQRRSANRMYVSYAWGHLEPAEVLGTCRKVRKSLWNRANVRGTGDGTPGHSRLHGSIFDYRFSESALSYDRSN